MEGEISGQALICLQLKICIFFWVNLQQICNNYCQTQPGDGFFHATYTDDVSIRE